MRVVYVISGLYRGGLENWLLTLAGSLVAKNYDVLVINLTGHGNLFEEYEAAGVKVVCLDDKKVRAGTFRFDTTMRLRSVVKKLNPDIIQTMHFSANYHTRLATIGMDIPQITNIHTCGREKKPFRRFMNQLLSLKTTQFVSDSYMVKEVVDDELNYFKKPSSVIYNGLLDDFTQVEPAELSEFSLTDGPVFVAAARLVPVKNIAFFLKIFSRILKIIPDANFLILGDGDLKDSLIELTTELGIGDNVVFAGMRNDVPALFAALTHRKSVVVMPSLWEGFPIVGLESLAFGLPLVVSDNVSLKEVADEAVLTLPLEESVWEKEIVALVQDDVRYQRLVAKELEIAERFRFSNIIPEWEALYFELIARK